MVIINYTLKNYIICVLHEISIVYQKEEGEVGCSRQPILLNLERRFAAKAEQLTLTSTFYYGLGNILRFCLLSLDVAAGTHEILYLTTRWW